MTIVAMGGFARIGILTDEHYTSNIGRSPTNLQRVRLSKITKRIADAQHSCLPSTLATHRHSNYTPWPLTVLRDPT